MWANPITFDNRGQPRKPIDDQGYINGDGVLIYPGEEKLHPEEDRGVPGPVSTIQLANLRRGLQDHQYLTMAKSLGLTKEVDDAVTRDRAARVLGSRRSRQLSRDRRSVRGRASGAGKSDRRARTLKDEARR